MAALGIVISEARRVSQRLNWELLAVLLADLAAWLGIVLLCMAWTRAEAAELPRIGASCSYTYPGTSQLWRATLHAIAPGAGGIPWAWLTIDADPRRVVSVPLEQLGSCS